MAKLDLKKQTPGRFEWPKCVEKRLGFCAISVFTVYVSLSKEHLLET